MVTLVILIKSWVQNRVSTHAEDECQLYCDRLSSISINPRQTRWKSQSTTTSPLSTWTWPSFPWAYSLLGLRKLWRTASWTSAGLRQGTSHLNRTPTPTTMCYMNASRRCRVITPSIEEPLKSLHNLKTSRDSIVVTARRIGSRWNNGGSLSTRTARSCPSRHNLQKQIQY